MHVPFSYVFSHIMFIFLEFQSTSSFLQCKNPTSYHNIKRQYKFRNIHEKKFSYITATFATLHINYLIYRK